MHPLDVDYILLTIIEANWRVLWKAFVYFHVSNVNMFEACTLMTPPRSKSTRTADKTRQEGRDFAPGARYYNIQSLCLIRLVEMAVRSPSSTGAGIKAFIDVFDEAPTGTVASFKDVESQSVSRRSGRHGKMS